MIESKKDQDTRRSGTSFLIKLFMQVCILFAQAALVTLFVGKLHEWADRVPVIGFWQSLSLIGLWYVVHYLDSRLRV